MNDSFTVVPLHILNGTSHDVENSPGSAGGGCNIPEVMTILFLVLICVLPPAIIICILYYWYKKGHYKYVYSPSTHNRLDIPHQKVTPKHKQRSTYQVIAEKNAQNAAEPFPEKKNTTVRFG